MSTQGNKVHIILYAVTKGPLVERLHWVIAMHLAKDRIETCQTAESLSHLLARPLPDPMIFVLLIFSKKELFDILNMRNALQDRRIILILPDDDPEILAMGHILRPRFLTYMDSDFFDVSTVLGRMIALHTCRSPALSCADEKKKNPAEEKVRGNSRDLPRG